jgi:hypothetical protein
MSKVVQQARRWPGYPTNARFWGWVVMLSGIWFEAEAVAQLIRVIPYFKSIGIL